MHDHDRAVLIVEDHAAMRRILRGVLAHLGFDAIEEAKDAAGALEKMRERKIGLVLADLDMVPVSGVEFVRAIRAHALLKDTPVIVTTAQGDRDQILAARAAGANSYIVTPFKAAALKQKIDAVLTAPPIL